MHVQGSTEERAIPRVAYANRGHPGDGQLSLMFVLKRCMELYQSLDDEPRQQHVLRTTAEVDIPSIQLINTSASPVPDP